MGDINKYHLGGDILILDLSVAVRVPGTELFVDPIDLPDLDAIVVDVPLANPDFEEVEDTDPGSNTIIGPIVHPRRPAKAAP